MDKGSPADEEKLKMAEDSSVQSESGSNDEKTPLRDQWSRQIEFALACVSYSVGYGNIWRFPYLCMRNGGGAFLIPYFLSLFLCGIPLFFLEMCLGQFSSLGPLHIWAISPLFKGLGYGMVILSFIICNYYNMVSAWVIYYLLKSFTSSLPWSGCDNWWNTQMCQETQANASDNYSGDSVNITNITSRLSGTPLLYTNISDDTSRRLPTEEYWKFSVLKISSGISDIGDIRWELFGCLALGWCLIAICLCKGIKSLGKVVFVTALFPYILLTIFLVRGLMLPGAVDGIKFYIIPKWGKLLHLKVWVEACIQIFYSLGPGWGGIIAMASHNKFNNNCVRDSIILPIINCGSSFFAGFVIFSFVGFMAHSTGMNVEDMPSGPGLTFIVYPEAILRLPWSPLWSILFFTMLLIVGFDSQFGNVEVVLVSLEDSFPKLLRRRKTLLTMLICAMHIPLGLIYCTQAGMYFFQLVDWYMSLVTVTLISVLECGIVMWIYGHKRFYNDITLMLGHTPSIMWKICWGVIAPGMLMTAQVYSLVTLSAPYYEDYIYPPLARGCGWAIAFCSAIPIPVYMVYYLSQQKGTLRQRLRVALSPTPEWSEAAKITRMNTDEGKGEKCEKEVLYSEQKL